MDAPPEEFGIANDLCPEMPTILVHKSGQPLLSEAVIGNFGGRQLTPDGQRLAYAHAKHENRNLLGDHRTSSAWRPG